MMLMMHYSLAVNYITCITPKKPLIFTTSWPPLFSLSFTGLWVSSPKLALWHPPHTPFTHFVRSPKLQPSLSAGFRDQNVNQRNLKLNHLSLMSEHRKSAPAVFCTP